MHSSSTTYEHFFMMLVNHTAFLSSKQTNMTVEYADAVGTLSFRNDEPQVNTSERTVSSFNINVCMQFGAINELHVELYSKHRQK